MVAGRVRSSAGKQAWGRAVAGRCRRVGAAVALASGLCWSAPGTAGGPGHGASPVEASWRPTFEGADATRAHVEIGLTKVATGFDQPTDVQFVPGLPRVAVVLEKEGTARWVELRPAGARVGLLLEVPVLTESEEGLLGLAFHPRFAQNGRFFLDYVAARKPPGGGPAVDTTVVEEWRIPAGADLRSAKARPERVVLEVRQPFQNHNGGQLQFGPDGMLYIALGDGGFRDDPNDQGQRPDALLGKLLRVDVDHRDPGLGYAIPRDNPFVGRPGVRPEIWALGLRNPWRFSFSPRGQLVVADVGQDSWEELDLVEKGSNAGWRIREGRHCHLPEQGCATAGLLEPLWEYDHHQGQCITGGYVATADSVPGLRGLYVFGDFVTGKLWALALPEKNPAQGAPVTPPATEPIALGKWPILPTTFGRDPDGALYVADFNTGSLFQLGPPASRPAVAPARKPPAR